MVTFSPGMRRQCIQVPILEDEVSENDEIFEVLLSSEDPAVASDPPMTSVIITDEDRVTVSLEMESYSTSEDEGFIEVCANITAGGLERQVMVNLATTDDTAEGKYFFPPKLNGNSTLVQKSHSWDTFKGVRGLE